jgi:ankyrin repeat protein
MNQIQPDDFFQACVNGDLTVVAQFVTEQQHSINIQNENGWTGLIMACFNENIELAKYLIENGADINATNHKGTTVFMYAKTPIQAKQHDTAFLAYLLDQGADINALDNKGKSVLDYVSENGYKILAEWLKKMGARNGQEHA